MWENEGDTGISGTLVAALNKVTFSVAVKMKNKLTSVCHKTNNLGTKHQCHRIFTGERGKHERILFSCFVAGTVMTK